MRREPVSLRQALKETTKQLRLGYAEPVPTGAQRWARFELEETLLDFTCFLRCVLQGRCVAARVQHRRMLSLDAERVRS